MPLQAFRPLSGRCKICHGDLHLSLAPGEPDPSACPKCGQLVERGLSLLAPQPKILRQPSPSEAKAAGFQVLKRIGKGEYEKQ